MTFNDDSKDEVLYMRQKTKETLESTKTLIQEVEQLEDALSDVSKITFIAYCQSLQIKLHTFWVYNLS